jgi:hypothetical protein
VGCVAWSGQHGRRGIFTTRCNHTRSWTHSKGRMGIEAPTISEWTRGGHQRRAEMRAWIGRLGEHVIGNGGVSKPRTGAFAAVLDHGRCGRPVIRPQTTLVEHKQSSRFRWQCGARSRRLGPRRVRAHRRRFEYW